MATTLTVRSKEVNTSIENNTSYVQVSVDITSTSYNQYETGSNAAYVNGTINGQNNSYTVPKTNFKISSNTKVTLDLGTFGPFTHNDDGSLNSVEISLYTWITSNATARSTTYCSMSTISRASTISLNTYNATVGETVTISIDRKSNSFTHNLFYQPPNNSNWIGIGSGITTSKDWVLTQDLISYFPTSPSGVFTIKCDTYNGSSYIGTSYTSLTLNLRVNIDAPNFVLGISEGNSIVSNANIGSYVQSQSKIKIEFIDITKCQNSPLDSVYVVLKNSSNEIIWHTVQNIGENVTSAEVLTDTITLSGQFTIVATVYDKRHGASIERTVSSTVLAYNKPMIVNASVSRSNSQGVESPSGTRLKYTFVGNITPLNNKNSKKFEIGYKLSTSSSFTYVTISTSTYSLNQKDIVLSGVTLNSDYVYDIIFRVTDSFGNITFVKSLGTDFKLMNFNASGKSMAFGTISNRGSSETVLDNNLILNCINGFQINGTDIQTIISNYLKKYQSFITLCLSSEKTITTTSVWEQKNIQWDKVWANNGEGYLTVNSDMYSINIADNIEYVEVSAQITSRKVGEQGAIEIQIMLNDGDTGISAYDLSSTYAASTSMSTIPTPLKVKKGDRIALKFVTGATGNYILYSDNTRPACNLTVKVLK